MFLTRVQSPMTLTRATRRQLRAPLLMLLLAMLPGTATLADELSVSDAWARATPPGRGPAPRT